MNNDLNSKLGIKPKSKVCLVRPRQGIISRIRQNGSDVNIVIGRVEGDCDVILYWVHPSEDIRKAVLDLQKRIKPDGRIWVIILKKEARQQRFPIMDWERLREEILKTHLVDNKVASINEEEYGTQFVIRKEHRPNRA